MNNSQKACPKCGMAAAVTAAHCTNCAHIFSTKFSAAEKTQMLSASSPAFFVPTPVRPRTSGASVLLMVIGAGTVAVVVFVLLVMVAGALVSPSKNTAAAPSGPAVSETQYSQIYRLMPERLMLSVVKHVDDTPIPDNGGHLWEFPMEDGGTLLVRCDSIYNEADQRNEFVVGYIVRYPANQSNVPQ